MLIPEFIRFYGYTLTQVLDEFAVTFFSLANDMYRIQATEIINNATAFNMNDEVLAQVRKQQRGLSGLVEEVKIAKRMRKS